MSEIQSVGSQVNIADLFGGGSGGSVQIRFAALQMSLAMTNKEKAMSYMDQVQASQEESKKIAEMISQARELQQKAANGTGNCSGDKKACYMPDAMEAFFKERGIKYDNKGNDNRHNKGEWDYNIKSLTNYQESVGSNTQQLMVFVQDFMGQYNSYLQGSNSAIQQNNQTMGAIAKGQ